MDTNLEEQPKRSGKVKAFLSTALLSALLVALVAVIIYRYSNLPQRGTSTGPHRREYEGKIIDKSLTIRESEYGSYPVRRLHIKGKDSQEFQVIVNEELYGRAQTGMWIKSRNAETELTWREP